MTHFTPDLVTLNYTRQHRRLQYDEVEDDDLLKGFITEASSEFSAALMRVPHPYVDTRAYDCPIAANFGGNAGLLRELEVNEDLLAITTLTNGDLTTISSSDYVLEGANEYPKWQIKLKWNSQSAFTYDDSPEQAISIAGIWGYVPHYARCWRQLTTLSAGISSSVTSMAVADGSAVEIGHYGLIGSEQVKVTDRTTNTLTIERGVNGTTAASHLNADTFKVFDQLPDIMGAVRAMVVYKYLTKDKLGARVQVYDGGVVQVEDLDPQVQKTINRHSRTKIMGVFR